MVKTFTLIEKEHAELIEKVSSLSETELHTPSNDSIEKIKNYSKALEANESKMLGDVFTVLN